MTSAPMLAHGLPADYESLPIPILAFYVAAAVVLVVSFLMLGLLWKQPRWREVPWRPVPRWLDNATGSPWLLWPLRTVVLLLLAITLATAAFGSVQTNTNPAPLLVFAVLWIGLVPLALVAGNVWEATNPWATLARIAAMPERARAWPAAAGLWLAFVLLAAFTWLELVYPTTTQVRLIAVLMALYSTLMLAGIARYGIATWLRYGEAFNVYSRLMASMSVWERREIAGSPRLGVRPPFLGTLAIPPLPGLAVLVPLLIGTVSYDGLSGTDWWQLRVSRAVVELASHGVSTEIARYAMGTFGMTIVVLLSWLAFEAASLAAVRLGRFGTQEQLHRTAALMAPTLLPIAVAYVVAHYFAFFVFQPWDLLRLADDPFGRGWQLFGTSDFRLQDYYDLLSARVVWGVQLGAIVTGHVVSLVLAHDRAIRLAPDWRRATLSQLPMLALMVLYTVGGLYFLSEGAI